MAERLTVEQATAALLDAQWLELLGLVRNSMWRIRVDYRTPIGIAITNPVTQQVVVDCYCDHEAQTISAALRQAKEYCRNPPRTAPKD
jgi:hypothetical protein